MIPEGQGNAERPGDSLGRFVAVLRVTSPDGSTRDIEVEADLHAAKLSLDPPESPNEV